MPPNQRRSKSPLKTVSKAAISVAFVFWVCILMLEAAFAQNAPHKEKDRPWPQIFDSQRGLYKLTLKPLEKTIPLRKLHRWHVFVERSDGRALQGANIAVDGGMPAHAHGLPSVPRVKHLPTPGNYLIEGMKFNMGGEWQMTFVINHQQSDRATISFDIDY